MWLQAPLYVVTGSTVCGYRHDTGEMSAVLLELDRRGAQLSAALAPLGRLRPLWDVLGRFKPGEVEEDLLAVPGRTLRHHGSLLKKTAVGKVRRHCFVFFSAPHPPLDLLRSPSDPPQTSFLAAR